MTLTGDRVSLSSRRQLSAAATVCLQVLAFFPRQEVEVTGHQLSSTFPRANRDFRYRPLHQLAYHGRCDTRLRGVERRMDAFGHGSPSQSPPSECFVPGVGLPRYSNLCYASAAWAVPRCSAIDADDGTGWGGHHHQQRQQQSQQVADGKLKLDRVKNIRDLASVPGSGVIRGRVFRTGCPSEATKADAEKLRDCTGLRTMVDLRSATEIERDELIHAGVYDGFMTIEDDDLRIWDGHTWDKTMARRINELFCGGSVEMEGGEEGDEPRGVGGESKSKSKSKRRYFVSLIDESVYKKAVFFRLRRRHKAAVMALAPATVVSRRCSKKARQIFLREINAGGLVLLNELLLQYSGKGINRVMRLLASRERHPVALYCTAGKDRTGLVMALTLAVLGVPDSAIVDDYAESDSAYRDLNDRQAMVGALAQEDLDPEIFLCAPRHVMEDILRFIRRRYGSIEGYLDSIGFDAQWRGRLRDALLAE